MLVSALSDIVLLVDTAGVIRDVNSGSRDLSEVGLKAWVGQAWADTVTVESRPKVEALLREALAGRPPQWRQVNHAAGEGAADLPVRYLAFGPREDGKILAVGRELRAVAQLQQRLVAAQQAMERDYARVRQAETRYRLLFQLSSEALLIVDAATRRIVDANAAASQLIGLTPGEMLSRTFPDALGIEAVEPLTALLGTVAAGARPYEVRLDLPWIGREFMASASLFRDEGQSQFLVRLAALGPPVAERPERDAKSAVAEAIERMPDGFVVTDANLRILDANAAFLALTQMVSVDQIRGEALDRWLGRAGPGVDVNVLVGILREHGSVRQFRAVVRGEFGAVEETEIAAIAVKRDHKLTYGFSLRRSQPAQPVESLPGGTFPRSTEQLTELIGRVPLKDLVKETTDLIERMCIEAALELTGDNRASAAEMLGLSRQSLYVKLRRYGVGEAPQE